MAVILVDVAETIVKEIYFWCARTQGFAQKAGRIMRRIWLLCWLILTVLPSWAAKRLSVAQLEQLLTADFAAHKQDSEIARKLAGVALSERISQTTFARLDEQFHSSPLASQALRVLADQSQFLDLPVDESVSNPAPENEAQTRMLHAAQDYVSQTLRRLPNFLATRTINLYDDTPQAIRQGEWPTRAGLHLVGKSSAEISVSREREDQPPAQGSAIWQSKIGLLSGGEFGTTLGMILTDMATGEVRWSHWERTSPEMLAVFRYSVPASASHFELISSFQREASLEGFKGPADDRGVAGISVRPNVSSSNIEVVRTRPGYHGSIWLNPADGTVYRITMEADMNKGLPFHRAAIMVEYGPIDIAGSRFICPVRSLALSEALGTAQSVTGNSATACLTRLCSRTITALLRVRGFWEKQQTLLCRILPLHRRSKRQRMRGKLRRRPLIQPNHHNVSKIERRIPISRRLPQLYDRRSCLLLLLTLQRRIVAKAKHRPSKHHHQMLRQHRRASHGTPLHH